MTAAYEISAIRGNLDLADRVTITGVYNWICV